MQVKAIYAKLSELILAAWNDDLDGTDKLARVTKEAQVWFEEHDTDVLKVLPIPPFAQFALAQVIDSPTVDKKQAFLIAVAAQKAYEGISLLSDFSSDLFEDLSSNSQAIIDVVLARLGVKS